MAYDPNTGKGLGRLYDANHRAFRFREWKGLGDTMYEYGRWLKLYGFMAVQLGPKAPQLIKAMLRYRWLPSYLTAAGMMDRHTIGQRGKELRYSHEQFFSVLHHSVVKIKEIVERDANVNGGSARAAALRDKTVMFDEMTPSLIMMGFPTLDWVDIAMYAVGMPSEVDQNSCTYYIDAIERFGLAPDVCPEPATECGVAVVDDYPKVGKCYVTSSMPCDGAVQQTALMTRYLGDMDIFQITPPQRINEPEVQGYAVKDLKKAIKFIEDKMGVKWDWDAFWENARMYNEMARCMEEKWEVNATDYPQVCGAALALQREFEFMGAACLDRYMLETDLRVTEMIHRGYERDAALDAGKPRYRCIVWACPAHYYTNFTCWADLCWGVRCVNDMEAMLSYNPITIGDEEQALYDLARCYERMMMRSHTNGGYANLLDELWRMCERFRVNIVIMYDHVSCKNVGGLHGLFEDQARERGIHLIWVPHDVMDPRTVSRREMREAFNSYMINVMRAEPLDPTLLDYEDALTW